MQLDRNKAIAFMGTMNAMPMMYALELRAAGWKVVYLVDVPGTDTLSRPENHYPEITYPYPDWILEFRLPSQVLLGLCPWPAAEFLISKLEKQINARIGTVVLNGMYTALAPILKRKATVVALSHGADLDVWADLSNHETLVATFQDRSIFRYLPTLISKLLIVRLQQKQLAGYMASKAVLYFPKGFNAAGDRVLALLERAGVKHIPRLDVSFRPVDSFVPTGSKRDDRFVILSPVRFIFKTFPEGNEGYNKGNDSIIRGIARYAKTNPSVEVHFVEKGEDVEAAKRLCDELQLSRFVTWHKEMPFKQLLELYAIADVVFDQVGRHWIGAVGAYAMRLEKPLIANDLPCVRAGIWPTDNPVSRATNEDEVYQRLLELSDERVRRQIGKECRSFVTKYMGPEHALNQLLSASPCAR